MNHKKIIIGTRGSKLSLVQTTFVKNLLQNFLSKKTIEILTIKTSGDKNMSPIPLDSVGKGWFTKEIDRQLLDGKIDIAVHSLKDLLDILPPGLTIAAIPIREDASEALVTRNGKTLKELKKRAVIGTDSIRRKIQLQKMRKDLIIKSVRGNVNRRLEKLDAGEYDGICVAVAGLKRLGLEKRITEYFLPTDFIPSPGQGALAIVTRKNDKELNKIIKKLNHRETITTVTAEREFSKTTGGGCSMPVGAYAETYRNKLTLHGMLGSEDGKYIVKAKLNGDKTKPKELAKKLAAKLLKESASWYRTQKVVLTRESEGNKRFAKKLHLIGLPSYSLPSIVIKKNLSTLQFKKYLKIIPSVDWIIFTSSNGVIFFIDQIKNLTILKQATIAAVGEQTAKTVEGFGLKVSFIPKTFTASELVKTIKNVKGKTILLPRSSIADPKIITLLKKKGATIIDMPIYKTEIVAKPKKEFQTLLINNQIRCLTFTSPSTIEGFLKNTSPTISSAVKFLPVVSIGPVTTTAAKRYGFTKIFTAKPHTVDGMITQLKRNVL